MNGLKSSNQGGVLNYFELINLPTIVTRYSSFKCKKWSLLKYFGSRSSAGNPPSRIMTPSVDEM